MNDYREKIQSRYFTLLSEALDVPVYDINAIPSNPQYPYVAIADWTEVDSPSKSDFGSELTLNIRVHDRATQSASRIPVYRIADKIKSAIRTRPVPFADIDGVNVITATLDDHISIPRELVDGFTYLGESLRFRHIIQQLPQNKE